MVKIESGKIYHGGGRRYLTLRSAIYSEARKIIERKHPAERPSYDADGQCYDNVWHWREMKRSDVLLRRVCRLVKSAAQLQGNPS